MDATNQLLLSGSNGCWSCAMAFMVGKLSAQQTLANTNICRARSRVESIDMGRYATGPRREDNGRVRAKEFPMTQ